MDGRSAPEVCIAAPEVSEQRQGFSMRRQERATFAKHGRWVKDLRLPMMMSLKFASMLRAGLTNCAGSERCNETLSPDAGLLKIITSSAELGAFVHRFQRSALF